VPAAITAFDELALLAEADCEDASSGLLRAAFIPDADWANDCTEDVLILWLFSARASPLITPAVFWDTDGDKELFSPAALAVFDERALLAEADCMVVSCGLLLAALMGADCARDCDEAMVMLWLFSARAWPLRTLELA
jgi:hypothetical protein